MNADAPQTPSESPPIHTPTPAASAPPTPLSWRLAIAATITLIGLGAWFARDAIGVRGQALAGVLTFFGIVAVFSRNLRAVNWRTVGAGFFLQLIIAVVVLHVPYVKDAIEA